MKITLIAAMDDNLGIGKDGKLPWNNKEDLQHFKDYTEYGICVMGGKTWESLPVKPLPFRINCVISRDIWQYQYNDADRVFNSIDGVIEYYTNVTSELIIIGGASIYEQFMPYATHMVLTHINGDYNCDTFFPDIDASEWFAYEWKDIENGKVHYMERNNDI